MIHLGDCLDVMRTMEPDSFDSVVTDPPYGIGFMGKAWDHGVPGEPFWREALRVAKPGAFLAAFGGTRKYHRLACAIEDAGWELRDCAPYVHEGVTLEPMADCPWLLAWVYGSGFPKSHNGEWGGTALKPAWEPIILARKPPIGTVAVNHALHGTGGLNIDGCRVPGESMPENTGSGGLPRRHDAEQRGPGVLAQPHELGRWPANVLHDGSAEVLAAFPNAPGQMADASTDAAARKTQNCYGAMRRGRGNEASADSKNTGAVGFKMPPGARRIDSGSAARFFYCAKASRDDRNDGCDGMEERPLLWSSGTQNPGSFQTEGTKRAATNNHPTVKPTDLMRWLCRLVTPAGGLILDPFMGSGSTGRAAIAEGMRFEGIELDPAYIAIAEARIRAMQPGLSLAVPA